MTKKERLEKYLKYKGIGPTAFARAIGISNSHVSEINTRKNNRTLYLAIRSSLDFSDCNTEWIDTGEGEMFQAAQRAVTWQQEEVAEEKVVNFSRSNKEPPRMAVKTLKRSVSNAGWELLDCFEALCKEQKDSLLIVARTMAAGVPVKSQTKEPREKD